MNKYKFLIQKLRQNQTKQELKLWSLLRNRNFQGLKFKRQYNIGDYIVDFVCLEHKVIIEIDGGQHNEPEEIELDNERTKYLQSKGFRVIRFWNNEIDNNFEGVYLHLQEVFGDKQVNVKCVRDSTSPLPPLLKERENLKAEGSNGGFC